VRHPVPAPEDGPVVTDRGSVRARHVIVAADGALPTLVPEYAERVRARRLHMVATEPLPPAVEQLVYLRWGYEYLQQQPDGRILAGGFSDEDGEGSYTDSDDGSPAIWERVERYLREELGSDARVSHRWTGVVGYSDDSLPYVGEVPGRRGLYVSGGYSGHGNVPGYMCGRDLADAIAGDGPDPLFPAGRSPQGLNTGG
jgi:glycine/D-amino acid oxidase-like deaminating enzyme